MKKSKDNRGIADVLVLVGLVVLSIAIPVSTSLVKKRQEIRNYAAEVNDPCKVCSGRKCITVERPPNCTNSLNECSSDSQCAPPPAPTSTPRPTSPPQPTSAPPPTSPPQPTTPPQPSPAPSVCSCPHACSPGVGGCWRGSGPYTCPSSCCDLGACPTPPPRPSSTPTPTPTPAPCQGTCFEQSCSSLNRPWSSGNCPSDRPFCCGVPPTPNPTPPPRPTSTPTPTPRPSLTPTPTLSCRGENQSCSSSNSCCSGLVCTALPGGYFCIRPNCSNGQKRCLDNFLQECQNGNWVSVKRCDAGCDSGTNSCKQVCTPNTKQCSDANTLETCATDGFGWRKEYCPYGCDSQKKECNSPGPCHLTPCKSSDPAQCVGGRMKRCNYLLLSEGGKCTGWFWVDMGNEYAKDCQQAQNTGDRWDLSLASNVEPFSGAEVPTGVMECRPNPNGRFSSLQACEEELRRQNQTGLAVAAGGAALIVAGVTAPAWAPAAAAASAPLVYQAGQAYAYAQPALQTVQRVSMYAGAAGAFVGIVGEATGNTRLANVGRGVTEVALGVGGAAEVLNTLGPAASYHGSFSGGYLDARTRIGIEQYARAVGGHVERMPDGGYLVPKTGVAFNKYGEAFGGGIPIRSSGADAAASILRIYSESPGMQKAAAALREGSLQSCDGANCLLLQEMEQAGIVIAVVPEGYVQRLTGETGNFASLQGTQGNILLVEKPTWENPWELMGELVHELGAFRLIGIYGSKSDIPYIGGFPATHWIDRITKEGGQISLSYAELYARAYPGDPYARQVLEAYLWRMYNNGLTTGDFREYNFFYNQWKGLLGY